MEIIVDKRDMDDIPCDVLGLWHFSDEMPLKGLAGLLDWRLDGRLSEFVLSGMITGQWGEKVLIGSLKALPDKTVIVLGLGPMKEFDSKRIYDAGMIMSRTSMSLGKDTICMPLPGSGIKGVDTVVVAEKLLEGFAGEIGDKNFIPWVVCGEDDMDEVILGFQKTKVKLKSQIQADIVQV